MLKAIQTKADGILFRSRTEARWALFFSACHIKYQYEREGFHLEDGGLYVPDFYLPEYKCWVEIKGEEKDHETHVRKLRQVTDADGSFGFVFVGQPIEMKGTFVGNDSCDSGGGWYGQRLNAGIAIASKSLSMVVLVNDGRSDRSFYDHAWNYLEEVYQGDYRDQWFGSGVFDAAREVERVRFWK